MKKTLLWLVSGLGLLIGGGALASLSVPVVTLIGVVLAVMGFILIAAWFISVDPIWR